MVEALARHLAVRVAAPLEDGAPDGVAVDPLPGPPVIQRWRLATSASPSLGGMLLGPERARALARLVARHRPRTVLFAQSYLAAVAPTVGVPIAVDFPDVEVRRMVSLAASAPSRHARVAFGLEAVKARRWEPRVVRSATVVSAVSDVDAALLARWGAAPVLVPNGAATFDYTPSPARGPVTFVANFGYQPNRDAARFLLEALWPRLRAAAASPELRLSIVGRGAARALAAHQGIEALDIVSDPETVEPYYREASVVLAPVRAGGGAQVKVTEALARGRVVVASPFSAAAAPSGADVGLVVADGPDGFARRVLDLWTDPDRRWAMERALVARRPVPTWDETIAPLADALLRSVPAQRR